MLLFLSHAGVDSEAALRLARLIEASPAAQERGLKVWVDKTHLVPGLWQRQLENAIEKQSTAFAVYVGSSGVMNWVESEVRLGLSRATGEKAYPFIPILGPHCAGSKLLPAFARQYQGVRDPEHNPDELQKLVRAALGIAGLGPVEIVKYPFLGLRAFEEDHAHLFFGRRDETRELVERLGKTNLLMVVGDSGSGKSSLVKAGVVPAFRGGALADTRGGQPDETVWQVLQMRPRGNPFEQLIEAATAGVDAATGFAIADRIRTREATKVGDALAAAAPSRAKLLLVVDQFEELWTQTPEAERWAFVEILLGLTSAGDDHRRIVLTMRRDYYNLCSALPELYRRLEDPAGQAKYSLRRMSDAGLRACIIEPLKLGGIAEAGVFAEEVLRDVGDEPADLALLEMALTQAWQRRGEFNGDLLQAYVGSGRVAGALAQAADRVFAARLSKEPLDLVKGIFIRLVRLGDTGGTTRRVATRDEFGGEEGRETVELSHEALVTQWPLYQTWLEEAAPHKRTLDALILDAKRWMNAAEQQKPQLLLTGYDLEQAVTFTKDLARAPWLSEAERAFVTACETARQAEDAKRRQDEQRRRLLLRVAIVTTILAGVAAGVAGFFWDRTDRLNRQLLANVQELDEANAQLESAVDAADTAAREAGRQRNIAETERANADKRAVELQTTVGNLLGATAQRLLDPVTDETAPVVAALAIESWRLAPTADAWNAVQRLPLTGVARAINLDTSVQAVAVSPDGELLAVGALDNTARLIELETGEEVQRISHGDFVLTVAFSPDGRLLATGGRDGDARLFMIATGEEVRRFAHGAPVSEVLFSPDGRLLATASGGDSARLLEIATGKEVARATHEKGVSTIAFSPDGRFLAMAGEAPSIRFVDTATTEDVAPIDHEGSINALAFSPQTWLMATGARDNTARLIETGTGGERARIYHEGVVTTVAFSPDGRLLATGSWDNTARLIDVATGKEIARIAHSGIVSTLAFSPDGRWLVTGSGDNTTLRLIEIAPGREQVHIVHGGSVRAMAFSSDGRLIGTGGQDGTARLIEISTGKTVTSLTEQRPVIAMAFSHDGRLAAVGGDDGTARLIEAATGTEIRRVDHAGAVNAVAFNPDGKLLASGSDDMTALLTETATGQEVARMPHAGRLASIAFSPDGRLLATGGYDNAARLFEVPSGREVARIEHGDVVWTVAFSPDGRLLATGSWDHTARIIDTASFAELARIEHGNSVWAVAFSPDNRLLATGGEDDIARLFDVATAAEVTRIRHDGDIWSVAFSPDGRLLATGSRDRTVRLTDVAARRELTRISHDWPVRLVAFSRDGDWLAVGTDAALHVWSVEPADIFSRLCAHQGRNLALEQWRRYVGEQPWQATCDCWETPAEVIAAGLWPPRNRELHCPKP